ncbi:hypothetical protein ILYODFUR_027911 [Ilyodon furcidens]|uniref:Uncharacterized protein n=1 Tax=Ilyodon furcidens TaxID=33524 RepID=A0ABV0V7N5_9TELE
MDLQDAVEHQERSIFSLYKSPKTEWRSPLSCKLEGNTNITEHFEGEADHLTPSTAQFLLDSNMFLVAGRIISHSFLHGAPCLAGLSPAIVHVLLGGTPETSTIHANDCSDIDLRTPMQLLEGTAELTPDQRKDVRDLAWSWDLPDATENNQKWLHERLLLPAVSDNAK